MNTSSLTFQPRANQLGISLFEMLLAVSILGIMAALTLPSFGQHRDVFADVKAKRNAQEMVSECLVAQVAGAVNFVGSTVEETIESMLNGSKPLDGPFAGRSFGLKQLNAADAHDAAKYLKITNGQLVMR